MTRCRLLLITLLMGLSAAGTAQTNAVIRHISFPQGEQDFSAIRLEFSGRPVQPSVYVTPDPPRFVLDFANVGIALEHSRFTLSRGNISAVQVLGTGSGARLAVELVRLAPHRTRVQGQTLLVEVRDDQRDYRLREVAAGPAQPEVVAGGVPEETATYGGERLSLNFQDIEVRAVLQLIADFTQLNLVASDTVTGNITLRLQDVPWDQALELVLKTRGLDQRRVGNVLMVAPVEEIAERERQQIEANRQLAELAPLETAFLQIRYARAADVVELLGSNGGDGDALVSARGSVALDQRTNAVLITDTAARLAGIRDLIQRIDVPIRQVMIEARIVIVQSDVAQSLGIRWGGAGVGGSGDEVTWVSGIRNGTGELDEANAAGRSGVNFPAALLVDLGVSSATSGIAVGYTSADLLLGAELSALEHSGTGEVISQPKVITGDKQMATIKSGTEIPFQESSSNGETTTSFREAVLALEVTPNITPDDHILLDLAINQDSLGDLVPSGQGGFIPSIDTTRLATQVLVGNGETVVLGGVFRTEDVDSVAKVPVLGDIPYLGRLFRNNTARQAKTETLIFITPRILARTLGN